MPNIKSAEKRVLVNNKKNLQNKMITSEIKTSVKKFNLSLTEGDKKVAETLLRETIGLIDSACLKGVYNRNYASRKQSQLQKAFNQMA